MTSDNPKHEQCIDDLVKRLARKPFNSIVKDKAIRMTDGHIVYVADVYRTTKKGDLLYATAYEIKTGGMHARHTAIEQARKFYGAIMFKFNIIPNFVYINTTDQSVERWTSGDILTGRL